MSSPKIAHAHLLKNSEISFPKLHSLITKNGPLKLQTTKYPNIFFFLAKTCIGQQLSATVARTIWGKVESRCKEKNFTVYEFFSYENIDEIRICGISASKSKAIIQVNERYKSGELADDQLLQANYSEIKDIIKSNWGFGDWSADMCAIFYCKLPDVLPLSDIAIINGAKKLTSEDALVDELFDSFSPYRSYLCKHIWKGLDDKLI